MIRFAVSFVLLLFIVREVRSQTKQVCICTLPVVTSQPLPVSGICVSNSVITFSVAASGTAPLTYQWQVDSVNINDDATFNGCNSPTLTVTNPGLALNSKAFRCVISNCLRVPVATDNSSTLTMNVMTSDINADGVINNADFAMLLGNYDFQCAGCREDINQDGVIDILDFLRLLSQFNHSCF